MTKPYVLTNDLQLVFREFGIAVDKPEIKVAIDNASNGITAALRDIYDQVQCVPAERMLSYLSDKIIQNNRPVISLTSFITENGFATGQVATIGSSRTVKFVPNAEGDTGAFESLGSLPRSSDLPCLNDQFFAAANALKAKTSEIDLIDDVIFTGGTIVTLAEQLKSQDLKVNSVIANVAIQGGIDRLSEHGISVEADFIYSDVVDEVCMRDFVLGAPNGGRNLQADNGRYMSVPYTFPFGDVPDWASVAPENAPDLSRKCLEVSLNLWEVIGPNVRFKDLSKPVFMCDPEAKVTETITRLLESKSYERCNHSLRL